MSRYITGTGQVVNGVHPEAACKGRGCPIHHPSNHHMADWKTHWRDDRRLMERVCEHGVGHPDPDDMAHHVLLGTETTRGVHGCDGCCHG